mgnify:CR=1 FL=1
MKPSRSEARKHRACSESDTPTVPQPPNRRESRPPPLDGPSSNALASMRPSTSRSPPSTLSLPMSTLSSVTTRLPID